MLLLLCVSVCVCVCHTDGIGVGWIHSIYTRTDGRAGREWLLERRCACLALSFSLWACQSIRGSRVIDKESDIRKYIYIANSYAAMFWFGFRGEQSVATLLPNV